MVETIMNTLPAIYGEMGGAPSAPINMAANLRSDQSLLMLFVVSEGEVTSLEDIYFNDVSISEFKASFSFTYGEVTQGMIPYLNASAVTESIGTPIPYNDSAGATRPISGDFDYIDVYINFSNIVHTEGNNKVYADVSFNIYSADSSISPTYILAYLTSFAGKSDGAYQVSYRINRPIANNGDHEWSIKIAHTNLSGYTLDESCIITIQTISYYNSSIVSNYAGSALVAIRIEDASEIGGGIPQVSFKGKGVKLMLPSSSYYNPVTGLYRNIADTAWVSPTDITRATWTGAFHTVTSIPNYQYSNNLSWVIYNFLSDWLFFEVDGIRYPRGCEIPKEHIAHFTFEEFGRYCDELLSYQAYEGAPVITERRYTVNRQFFERKDAKTARDDLLTLGNAELIEYDGLVSIVWDRRFSQDEIDQSLVFTNQNVQDGIFEYASTDITDNNTQINVTIQEIDNRNKTRTLLVMASELEDFLGLTAGYFNSLYGYTSSDYLMLGCASVATGLRKGRNLLWDSLMIDLDGDGIVQFRCLIEAVMLHKGSLIRIHDSNMFDTIETGRVVSYASSPVGISLVLDRAITLHGITTLMVYDSLGGLVELLLEETSGTLNEVSATYAGTLELIPQSIFIQKSERTTLYKVSNITKEDNNYLVEAIKYDARKYDFIEQVVTLPSTENFVEVIAGKVPKVSNIQLEDKTSLDDITSKFFTLTWEHSGLPDRAYKYQVDWATSLGDTGSFITHSKSSNFTQTITQNNLIYFFTITALSNLDLPSKAVTFAYAEVRYDTGLHYDSPSLYYDGLSALQF
jgi:predicted phage tail protein